MKVSYRQLRSIIREKVAHPRDHLGKNIADVEFPIVVGYEDQSEIAYNQEELDNILDDIAPRGVPYSLDSLEDVEAPDRPVGASIEQYGEGMNVSKRRLRQIIKEERAKLIEQPISGAQADQMQTDQDMQAALKGLESIIGDFTLGVDQWFDRHNDIMEPTGMLDDPDSWAIRLEEMRYDLNQLAKEIMGGQRKIR